jgi:hypothetical protein
MHLFYFVEQAAFQSKTRRSLPIVYYVETTRRLRCLQNVPDSGCMVQMLHAPYPAWGHLPVQVLLCGSALSYQAVMRPVQSTVCDAVNQCWLHRQPGLALVADGLAVTCDLVIFRAACHLDYTIITCSRAVTEMMLWLA